MPTPNQTTWMKDRSNLVHMSFKVVQSTLDVGRMDSDMAGEDNYGQMAVSMRDIGLTIPLTNKADSYTLMETCKISIPVIISSICYPFFIKLATPHTSFVFLLHFDALFHISHIDMKDSGRMTKHMDRESTLI